MLPGNTEAGSLTPQERFASVSYLRGRLRVSTEKSVQFQELHDSRFIPVVKVRSSSPAQWKKVETRAAHLIAKEMTLRQLRQACKLTQEKVAKFLRIGQEGVSKLEKRSNLLISTLGDYVKAMGGRLSLVEFPDLNQLPCRALPTLQTQAPSQTHPRHVLKDV